MRPMPFRFFLLYLVFLVTIATVFISGSSIFILRYSAIGSESKIVARETIDVLASNAEDVLSSVENSIFLLANASLRMNRKDFGDILDSAMNLQPMLRAIYVIDKTGRTVAVGTRDDRHALNENFIGIDFSNMPLYNSLVKDNTFVWSDKFLSILSGDTSIGLGYRTKDTVIIAELSLQALLKTLGSISNENTRVWVIDRLGELVADTGMSRESGIINVRTVDFMRMAMEQEELPQVVEFNGIHYHPAWAHSTELGWLFIIGIPAGMDNALIKNTMEDLLLLSFSFIVTALILIPIISMSITSDVRSLKSLARKLAQNTELVDTEPNRIREFNSIRTHLHDMHSQIHEREEKLRLVNQTLEKMVDDRTKALQDRNNELQVTLENLKQVQDLALRSEKLAALGRLVAGIAHELNTPIGNALMAVTSIKDRQETISKDVSNGLTKSSFEGFMQHMKMGLDIAELNIQKVAELVTGFKHVANDQTSSIRRIFELKSTVDDVLLTLTPMLKRSPHQLITDVSLNLVLDSFPGTLGQILTNLITNALLHAWDEGEKGNLVIKTEAVPRPASGEGEEEDWVRISVEDNGKGIPESYGQRIFDPFFTTKMGQGGTGLGLNVAHNGAKNILGGILDYVSEEGKGTTFFLIIPLIAPKL